MSLVEDTTGHTKFRVNLEGTAVKFNGFLNLPGISESYVSQSFVLNRGRDTDSPDWKLKDTGRSGSASRRTSR